VLPHLHVLKKVEKDCHFQSLELIKKRNVLVILW